MLPQSPQLVPLRSDYRGRQPNRGCPSPSSRLAGAASSSSFLPPFCAVISVQCFTTQFISGHNKHAIPNFIRYANDFKMATRQGLSKDTARVTTSWEIQVWLPQHLAHFLFRNAMIVNVRQPRSRIIPEPQFHSSILPFVLQRPGLCEHGHYSSSAIMFICLSVRARLSAILALPNHPDKVLRVPE